MVEGQKKKLFIPRRLSKGDNRYDEWNNSQPLMGGVRINQYDDDGIMQGYWEFYHNNGGIWCKGCYRDGNCDGYWEECYENGNIWYKGEYKDGKGDGLWEYYWYDYNGKIRSRGSYKGGKRDGIWEYYDKDGNMEGIKHYDENGNI